MSIRRRFGVVFFCFGEDRDEGPISAGSEGRRQPCDTTDLIVLGLAVLELAN